MKRYDRMVDGDGEYVLLADVVAMVEGRIRAFESMSEWLLGESRFIDSAAALGDAQCTRALLKDLLATTPPLGAAEGDDDGQ